METLLVAQNRKETAMESRKPIQQSVGYQAALTTVRSYGYSYENAESILAQIYEGAGKWWNIPEPNCIDINASLHQIRYNRCTKTYSFK